MNKLLRGLAVDCAGLSGLALFSFGGWQVYPPLGFLLPGALLMLWAYKVS